MTIDNFLSFLQQLLTMVDPKNECSIAIARNTLSGIISLASTSQKVEAITLRAMKRAEMELGFLIDNRDDFIGKPGQYEFNKTRRHRLYHVIMPGC